MNLPGKAIDRRNGLLAVLALVLTASIVAGSEERGKATRPAASERPASPAVEEPAPVEDLDISKLYRARRPAPIAEMFAPKAPPAPPPAPALQMVKAEPPPALPSPPPGPPALPFRHVATFVEDGVVRLLVVTGEREYSIEGGETLEGTYRVDEVSELSATFTYLPLAVRQTLPIEPGN